MSKRFHYGFAMTARSALATLSVILLAISMVYWWGIQSKLTDDVIVALAFTAIVTFVPPILVSFVIPSSPAAMLLQRLNLRTASFPVIVVAAGYMLWYMFDLQWAWWAAQPVTSASDLVFSQVVIGMIGFVLVPALLWAPVSSEELAAYMRQRQMVDEYEEYAKARMLTLKAQLARAHLLAGKSIAQMTPDERSEFAALLRGIQEGIEHSTSEIKSAVDALYRTHETFEQIGTAPDPIVRTTSMFRRELLDVIDDEDDGDDDIRRRRLRRRR